MAAAAEMFTPIALYMPVCGSKANAIVVIYGYALNAPAARQAAISLTPFFSVTVIQREPGLSVRATTPEGVTLCEVSNHTWFSSCGPLNRLLTWLRFQRTVQRTIRKLRPELVVTIMPHALASLPKAKSYQLVSCIWDIFPLQDLGSLDRFLVKRGLKRLAEADVVWASDSYKAELAQEQGQLLARPLVCHNCPPLDYLPESTFPRDGWLRAELRQQGATLGETSGSILLRAGAVGEYGGIEETLRGMRTLPEDYIFVMMGRPPAAYKREILRQIANLGMKRRAFLWDRADDATWKKVLQGADIGHLIHGPFPSGRMTRLYELNSSLSNNGLFQFMAAGLPIISYVDPRMDDLFREVPCFRVVRMTKLEDDIQTAWRDLGANPVLRHQLGKVGRNAHLSKYNWEKQYSCVIHAIKN